MPNLLQVPGEDCVLQNIDWKIEAKNLLKEEIQSMYYISLGISMFQYLFSVGIVKSSPSSPQITHTSQEEFVFCFVSPVSV